MLVGSVAVISEVHAAYTFRIEMCRLVSCGVYITFCLSKEKGVEGDIVGIGASSMPVGTANCDSCADGPCMGLGIHRKSHQHQILLSSHPSNYSPGKMFHYFLLWVECHGGWLEVNFKKQNCV